MHFDTSRTRRDGTEIERSLAPVQLLRPGCRSHFIPKGLRHRDRKRGEEQGSEGGKGQKRLGEARVEVSRPGIVEVHLS